MLKNETKEEYGLCGKFISLLTNRHSLLFIHNREDISTVTQSIPAVTDSLQTTCQKVLHETDQEAWRVFQQNVY